MSLDNFFVFHAHQKAWVPYQNDPDEEKGVEDQNH